MPSIHNIKAVAVKTGLSQHVIRVWEKRYSAVSPIRTDTNRRLYREEEVERLCLLQRLTRKGFSIGQIAQLPTPDLKHLVETNGEFSQRPHLATAIMPAGQDEQAIEKLLAHGLKAVYSMDGHSLESVLDQASVEFGRVRMLQDFAAPLIEMMGEGWEKGELTIAHEHFASATLRNWLGRAGRPYAPEEAAPILVVATPPGQLHELGAILASACARFRGWKVIYLGCCLPAEEIARTVRDQKARAVALSLVYPQDDPDLPHEILRLRRMMGEKVTLMMGGRALCSYAEALKDADFITVQGILEFGKQLDQLRHSSN